MVYDEGSVLKINLNGEFTSCIVLEGPEEHLLLIDEYLLIELEPGVLGGIPYFKIVNSFEAAIVNAALDTLLKNCYLLLIGDKKVWYEIY